MSKVLKRNHKRRRDELRPEYRFDYRSSRANRFAAQLREDVIAVVLEPNVAESLSFIEISESAAAVSDFSVA